jgi:alpha-L-fucosidase
MMNKFLTLIVCLFAINSFSQQTIPQPYGAVPTQDQINWHKMEMYNFLHFTTNTFTDKEWGYGDEKESVFNPTDFNADQIISTLYKSGFKGVILTCKHHDGFCLWPSKFTEHSVKNSIWKNGKGDVVREISNACKRHGMKFGIYLSPWDRNSAMYGKPEYITYYRNQLEELLTNYGDIFEVWLDGANGGDGFYGGAKEKREIDRTIYYQWESTWAIIRKLQPKAIIFSDLGPDSRWVGNEEGYANDSCWAPYTPIGRNGEIPGIGATQYQIGETGTKGGNTWMPAEVDVSIRPGWFYHAKEDTKQRDLKEIYFKSVGNGGCFNLNVPPDRKGQIQANDIKALDKFSKFLKESFTVNYLAGKKVKVTATETRGNAKKFKAKNVLDKNFDSYWATNDQTKMSTLTFELPKESRVNCMEIQEYIPLGQRIESFTIEIMQNGNWVEVFKGSTIGYKKLARFKDVRTNLLRIKFMKSLACPIISKVALYQII